MVTMQTKKAYTEILEVLKYIPKEYVKKIPKQIIEVFESEKLEDYTPIVDKEKPIDKEKLQKETLEVIAMLNYNYWCTDEKTKKELYSMYSENEEKYQKEITEKYDVNNVFKKRKTILNNHIEENNKETSLLEYKENILKKIINKIKKLIK